jgi:DNA helicase IV
MSKDLERQREQGYFDSAQDARERFRHGLQEAPDAGAHARMAYFLRKRADEAAATLGGPDDAVAVGRIDLEGEDTPLYVGLHAILDETREPLVVNWQAPIAAPFHKATPKDPQGVRLKRSFVCEKNRIVTFDDIVFAEIAERIGDMVEDQLAAGAYDDALLGELVRQRTGEMREIVQTIQAAQYDLICQPLDQLLVVQGGPGTGKTVVALHRVSWLLFNHRDALAPSDVLVVGPNKTFVRYIRQVLPTLGDAAVKQIDLTGLAPAVRLGLVEDEVVSRLKGDLRMGRVLDQALRDRIGVPEGPIELRLGRRAVQLSGEELRVRVADLARLPYNVGRTKLRDWLREDVRARHRENPAAEALELVLERIWPQLSAPAFLQELLGSEARIVRAAGEHLTARDVQLLYRRAAPRLAEEVWSDADLPLLDHLEYAMSGSTPQRFRHVVVDEAQDLSPMQVASIARRMATPSATLLGDLAQSTGPWTRSSWGDIVDELRAVLATSHQAVGSQVVELEHGYRVPRQIYELAAKLLPVIAPELRAPTVVRDGQDPVLHHEDVDDIAGKVVQQAMEYSALGLLVGIVCPAIRRGEVITALEAKGVNWRNPSEVGLAAGINLLDPETAKGLEVDATVVAYPEDIVDGLEVRGGRLLYIALTRSTRHLAVVYSSSPLVLVDVDQEAPTPLPVVAVPPMPTDHGSVGVPEPSTRPASDTLSAHGGPAVPVQRAAPARRPRAAERLAEELAQEIRSSLQPALWPEVVAALTEMLELTEALSED